MDPIDSLLEDALCDFDRQRPCDITVGVFDQDRLAVFDSQGFGTSRVNP